MNIIFILYNFNYNLINYLSIGLAMLIIILEPKYQYWYRFQIMCTSASLLFTHKVQSQSRTLPWRDILIHVQESSKTIDQYIIYLLVLYYIIRPVLIKLAEHK